MPARRTESFGDPIGNYNFRVEIDGAHAGEFRQLEGISPESTKAVGPAHIILKRGYSASPLLHRWRKNFLEGREGRKSGSIAAVTMGGQTVGKWSFYEGWPCKVTSSGFNLDGKGGDATVEEIELVVERVVRA